MQQQQTPQMMMQQPGQPMMMQHPGQPMMMQHPGQPMMMQPGQPMMMQQPGQPMMMHPGQPMMMMPGQPQVIMMQQPVIKKKGWERLDRDSIFIKQKFNLTEAMTGCVQGNQFVVYPMGKDGDKKGKALFKAKEESGCCERQFMSGDCRPFVMKVKLEDDSEELDNEPFLLIDRPCKCTFYCFNRPEITVTCVEDGKDTYIGKVVNPWTLFNIQLDIFDKDNTKKYEIVASCCQLGFHCKAPCEACTTIDFDIRTPSGEVISTLQKRAPGCGGAMMNLENFLVHFPKGATKEDKALIMCAVLFADYRFFEEKGGKN